ncbi:hypothetical protein CDL15_Pgr015595 [Punica granatum]|uniref:Uncharacterized protein n=1 Tax=Punica granatum TaxID=22663 RepID=A0A218XP11_PUNGR|nr:hypothetical protein CDL15_Pgr015595 [Punica granatum]
MPDIHSKPNNFKLNVSALVTLCILSITLMGQQLALLQKMNYEESKQQGLLSEVLSAAAGVTRDKTMDFDEYEYLEKTVENPELEKVKEVTNGRETKTDIGVLSIEVVIMSMTLIIP